MKCLTKFLDSSSLIFYNFVTWSKNSQVSGVMGPSSTDQGVFGCCLAQVGARCHGTFGSDLS